MTMPSIHETVTPRKGIWDKCSSLAQVFASIAVPLAIAIVGNAYSENIKESENRVRYGELAIAQLRSPPAPQTAALREWAVALLDRQSPVKLSDTAKAELKSSALRVVSLSAAGGASASGTATLSAEQASSKNLGRSSAPDQ